MKTQNKATKEPEVVWTTKGANWECKFKAPISTCAMEVATKAVEEVWNNSGEEWKQSDGVNIRIKNGGTPTIGAIMVIKHSRMKSRDEHLMVYSSMVLANAGFHEAAAKLEHVLKSEEKD